MREGVDDGDDGFDLDGLAVEDGGAVAPLADCGESRLNEERIAGDDFERLDGTVSGDDGVELDAAFATSLHGENRIIGLDTMNEHGGLDAFAAANCGWPAHL